MSPSRRLPGAWKKSLYLENDARLRHSYYGMRIGNRTQAFECSVGSWIFERGWRVSSAIGARIEGWVWGGGVPLATGMGYDIDLFIMKIVHVELFWHNSSLWWTDEQTDKHLAKLRNNSTTMRNIARWKWEFANHNNMMQICQMQISEESDI